MLGSPPRLLGAQNHKVAHQRGSLSGESLAATARLSARTPRHRVVRHELPEVYPRLAVRVANLKCGGGTGAARRWRAHQAPQGGVDVRTACECARGRSKLIPLSENAGYFARCAIRDASGAAYRGWRSRYGAEVRMPGRCSGERMRASRLWRARLCEYFCARFVVCVGGYAEGSFAHGGRWWVSVHVVHPSVMFIQLLG